MSAPHECLLMGLNRHLPSIATKHRSIVYSVSDYHNFYENVLPTAYNFYYDEVFI